MTSDQGLPQSSVQDVIQSPDGYIWLATQEGVARFDGIQFQVFDKDTSAAFKSNDCTALAVDHSSGSLWVGTLDGLLLFRQGKFTRFDQKDGLPSPEIMSIFRDGTEHWWFGTGNGVTFYESGRFHKLADPHKLLAGPIESIAGMSDGRILFGTSGQGLCILEQGTITPVPYPPHGTDYYVKKNTRSNAGFSR